MYNMKKRGGMISERYHSFFGTDERICQVSLDMRRREMDNERLIETAILAGETMLRSGAEAYRVEDTMSHILKNADAESREVIVMTTVVMAELRVKGEQPLIRVKRVNNRGIDLNKVVLVNDTSRKLCHGEICLEEAYEKMKQISKGTYKQYTSEWFMLLTYIGAVIGFTIMFGGKMNEILAAICTGGILAFCQIFGGRIRMNGFMLETISAMAVTALSILLKAFVPASINIDALIVGSIMPMVPGVSITNAVRDTLQGDYLTGGSRMMEAFIHAAAIALGVGIGMAIFGSKFIGRTEL